MEHSQLRKEIISTAQAFSSAGLSGGTSGNLSARAEEKFFITPSGTSYQDLQAEDIVEMNSDGLVISGRRQPSSEWRFHKSIYLTRLDVNAVVHVHSPYATAIACTREDIPAFHYMIAMAGGDSIRCAEYATFGTEELCVNVLKALTNRNACLLANHGMIALGENISTAFKMAQEVETLAMQYHLCRQFSEPVLLDKEEMQLNLAKFRTYGKQTND